MHNETKKAQEVITNPITGEVIRVLESTRICRGPGVHARQRPAGRRDGERRPARGVTRDPPLRTRAA